MCVEAREKALHCATFYVRFSTTEELALPATAAMGRSRCALLMPIFWHVVVPIVRFRSSGPMTNASQRTQSAAKKGNDIVNVLKMSLRQEYCSSVWLVLRIPQLIHGYDSNGFSHALEA